MKDRWSQLSMSEKSDLMSLYIKNGISSLEEIKKHYNSFATGGHLYQEGGPIKIGYAAPPISSELEGAPVVSPMLAKRKVVYGSSEDTRKRVREDYPIINKTVDSIATAYNINPKSLNYRLDHEGFVDAVGRMNDHTIDGESQFTYDYTRPNNSKSYNFPKEAFNLFGLDNVATLINDGKVKLINENWSNEENTNEWGKEVQTAQGNTWVDNVGIMAATLKYFKEQAKKDFPNKDDSFYDRASVIYFNRGITGGKQYIKNGGSGYEFQQGGSLGKITPYGQWQYPHQVTTIPSNNITMKGVDYPVIGVSNTGDTKYMFPNMDYLFDGQYVTEYPVHKFQDGGPDESNSKGHVTFGTYDEYGNIIPMYHLNQVNVGATQPYRTPEQQAQVTRERNMYFDAMRHFNYGNQDAESLQETYAKYPKLRSYLKRIGMSENDFMAAATGRDYETNSYEKERTRQFNKDIQRAEADKANKLMQSVSHQNPNDKKLAAAMTGILGGVTGTGILGGLTSVGGLGNTVSNATNIALQGSKTALGAAGKMMLPSTWTTAAGLSSGFGTAADAAMFTDMVYHGGKNLLNYDNWQSNGRYNNDNWGGWQGGANLLLDLASVAPVTRTIKGGIGLVSNAVRSFESPILSQRTPNTLTRVIGSGTTGLEDAILTAGYLRGNPNGSITTAKNLNRRYLPKLKQAGASQGLYDRFASNALTEKDYEWLHKNMPENWFIDSTPAEEGVISLKGGVLPQTYEEYLQMYRSKNPQRTNVDIRTGEGLTSEDIAYNWAGENEPTFAVSKDIAKEMGYDYENILNNSLFRGDYAVQIKNARTHGVSGNNFPTGAHLDEHWSLKYPMEWNNPDVSFYKGFNIPLLNKKVYFKTNPIKSLLKKIESDYAAEIAKPKSEQNLERLQELRNQHFLAASPDNAVSKYTRQWWGKPLVTMFHGSPEHNGAFTEFNPKKSGGQFFFSPSEMYADTYGYGTKPRSFYLNADEFVGGYKETNTPGIWEPILENNEQVVRQTVKNNTKAGSIEGDMEFIVGDNRMIKSADPITYDNDGNVIPLSKRDNFNISDIRYILPFGIGTGATLLNSNKN